MEGLSSAILWQEEIVDIVFIFSKIRFYFYIILSIYFLQANYCLSCMLRCVFEL